MNGFCFTILIPKNLIDKALGNTYTKNISIYLIIKLKSKNNTMSDKVDKLFVKLANEMEAEGAPIEGYYPPMKVADNYSAYTTKPNALPQKMAGNYQTTPPAEPGIVANNEYYHEQYSGEVTEKSAQAAKSLAQRWAGNE